MGASSFVETPLLEFYGNGSVLTLGPYAFSVKASQYPSGRLCGRPFARGLISLRLKTGNGLRIRRDGKGMTVLPILKERGYGWLTNFWDRWATGGDKEVTNGFPRPPKHLRKPPLFDLILT